MGTGLGEELLRRGFDVAGRETVGEFRAFPFGQQVSIIVDDLTSQYWHEDARVIANSFGAYLFLHAQNLMKPFPGKVLLLSPIVGEFSTEDSLMSFIPPRAGRLQALASSGSYPAPRHCQIHVGEQDWQSNPHAVAEFAGYLGLEVKVVPNGGHMLEKSYVGGVLDNWLANMKKSCQ